MSRQVQGFRHDVIVASNSVGPDRGGAPRQVMLLANALRQSGLSVAVLTKEVNERTGLMSGVTHVGWHSADGVGRLSRARTRLLRVVENLRGPFWLLRRLQMMPNRRQDVNGLRAWLMLRVGRVLVASDLIRFEHVLSQLKAPAVIAFMPNVTVLVAFARERNDFRFISSYRSDPEKSVPNEPWASMQYLVGKQADLVTANSRGALASLRRQTGFERAPMQLSPNLLEKLPQSPAPLKNRFLSVCHLGPSKRVDVTIRAFSEVALQLGLWELVIVGAGPQKPALEQLVEELGLASSCTFLGHVGDTAPVFAEGGILVSSSEFEGSPNVIIEAMSHGLAFITSDASPGPVELASDCGDPSGLVVPVGSVHQTAQAMLQLAQGTELRAHLGEAGRRCATGMLWAAQSRAWESILERDFRSESAWTSSS